MALESPVRHAAVLVRPGITPVTVDPSWTEDSVLNALPELAQELVLRY